MSEFSATLLIRRYGRLIALSRSPERTPDPAE
jgi:hypothetical protein